MAARGHDARAGDDGDGARHRAGARSRDRGQPRARFEPGRRVSVDRLRGRGPAHVDERLPRAPIRRGAGRPGERNRFGDRARSHDRGDGAGHRARGGARRDGLRVGDAGREPRARSRHFPGAPGARLLREAVGGAARGTRRGYCPAPHRSKPGMADRDRRVGIPRRRGRHLHPPAARSRPRRTGSLSR